MSFGYFSHAAVKVLIFPILKLLYKVLMIAAPPKPDAHFFIAPSFNQSGLLKQK